MTEIEYLPGGELALSAGEYAKAFALNFVFFAAAVAVYAAAVSTDPLLIAALLLISVWLTGRRLTMIRPTLRRFTYQDRDLVLAVVDGLLKSKDRWEMIHEEANGQVLARRYESPLNVGLYTFTGVATVALDDDLGTLRLYGHERITRALARDLAHNRAVSQA